MHIQPLIGSPSTPGAKAGRETPSDGGFDLLFGSSKGTGTTPDSPSEAGPAGGSSASPAEAAGSAGSQIGPDGELAVDEQAEIALLDYNQGAPVPSVKAKDVAVQSVAASAVTEGNAGGLVPDAHVPEDGGQSMLRTASQGSALGSKANQPRQTDGSAAHAAGSVTQTTSATSTGIETRASVEDRPDVTDAPHVPSVVNGQSTPEVQAAGSFLTAFALHSEEAKTPEVDRSGHGQGQSASTADGRWVSGQAVAGNAGAASLQTDADNAAQGGGQTPANREPDDGFAQTSTNGSAALADTREAQKPASVPAYPDRRSATQTMSDLGQAKTISGLNTPDHAKRPLSGNPVSSNVEAKHGQGGIIERNGKGAISGNADGNPVTGRAAAPSAAQSAPMIGRDMTPSISETAKPAPLELTDGHGTQQITVLTADQAARAGAQAPASVLAGTAPFRQAYGTADLRMQPSVAAQISQSKGDEEWAPAAAQLGFGTAAATMPPGQAAHLLPNTASASSGAIAHQAAQAIIATVRSGKSGQIDVTLRPEELGRIRFEIVGSGERLHVNLFVERPDSMDLMRRNADQLLADLRQSGFGQATLSFGNWGGQKPAHHAHPARSVADREDGLPLLSSPAKTRQSGALGRLDMRL